MVGCTKLFVNVPAAIVTDKKLYPADLRLYMLVNLRPGLSVAELSRLTGYGRAAVRSQCSRLASGGWVVVVERGNRRCVFPTMPHEVQDEVAERFKDSVKFSVRKGETLMYEWLKVLVDAEPLMANVRPWFLQNPETGEFMEYDCFLPAPFNKAWEFQGPQHFGPTQMFPDSEAVKKLQTRDHVKASLSHKYGIDLITVTADDLSYEGMMAKVPPDVPLKYVDVDGPYVRALESFSRQYAANLRRSIARQERLGASQQ